MINWKVRFKNPTFWVSIGIAVITPILAYMGLTAQDLTTWAAVGSLLKSAVSNPYMLLLVAVSVYNAVIDPTTKGISDSAQALTYTEPKEN